MQGAHHKGLVLVWAMALLQYMVVAMLAVWLFSRPGIFTVYYPKVVSGASHNSQRLENALVVIDWLNGSDSLQVLERRLPFLSAEAPHFLTVRSVFHFIPWVCLLGVVLFFLLWWRTNRNPSCLRVVQERLFVFSILVMLGSTILAWWDWRVFFSWFHAPFFGADSWRLLKSPYGLHLFPIEFWNGTVAVILLIPILTAAALWAFIRINGITASEQIRGPKLN